MAFYEINKEKFKSIGIFSECGFKSESIEFSDSFIETVFQGKDYIKKLSIFHEDGFQYTIYYKRETFFNTYTHKFYAFVGIDMVNKLSRLKFLAKACEPASLSYLPERVREFIEDKNFTAYSGDYRELKLESDCVYIDYSGDSKYLSDDSLYKISRSLIYIINTLLLSLKTELNGEQLKSLKYKPIEQIKKETRIMHPWVADILKASVRAGVSILGGMIGAQIAMDFDIGDGIDFDSCNLNISGTDFDFDIDTDTDTGDYEPLLGDNNLDEDVSQLDSEYSVDTDEDNTVQASSNNVAFMGAQNDGTYSQTGQTVDIRSDGGKMYNDVKVYTHNGQKYIDFKDHFIKLPASGFFYYLANGYKIIN